MIQESHTHSCRRCGSQALRRNGSVKGKAKYHCTACGYHGYFTSALEQRQARYAQVEGLLTERLSQRAIVASNRGEPHDGGQDFKKKPAFCLPWR